MRNNVFQLKN
uniref:Uncharacterized protein n=1 Tax=Anguilla anguilla TaxID=7936 RepID=A0A0E9TDJ3_ANGAN